MSSRVQELEPGCNLYKLDLSRVYHQLRLDPLDWPIMSIRHRCDIYMMMMMERTSMAACYIHGLYGYLSKAYIDDFGAADLGLDNANSGYSTLRSVLSTVGLDIAEQKSCPPAHVMDWLGTEVNSIDMTLKIPEFKLTKVCEVVKSWETCVTAAEKQVQSLVGVLNVVDGVSPPTRIYSNRVLNFLGEIPNDTNVLVSEKLRGDGFF